MAVWLVPPLFWYSCCAFPSVFRETGDYQSSQNEPNIADSVLERSRQGKDQLFRSLYWDISHLHAPCCLVDCSLATKPHRWGKVFCMWSGYEARLTMGLLQLLVLAGLCPLGISVRINDYSWCTMFYSAKLPCCISRLCRIMLLYPF